MKTPQRTTRKVWIVAIGLSSPERKQIKCYLTKKRALAAKAIVQGVSKSRIIPATLTYEIKR